MGGWNLERDVEQYRARAAAQTAAVLRRMGTIEVGDTIPNFPLASIDGRLFTLSQSISDRAMIVFLDLDCDACLSELETLSHLPDQLYLQERVVVVTATRPLDMFAVRERLKLRCLILYDERRALEIALNIESYPFNIVVNQHRVIEEIVAAQLIGEDFARLIEPDSLKVNNTKPASSSAAQFENPTRQ